MHGKNGKFEHFFQILREIRQKEVRIAVCHGFINTITKRKYLELRNLAYAFLIKIGKKYHILDLVRQQVYRLLVFRYASMWLKSLKNSTVYSQYIIIVNVYPFFLPHHSNVICLIGAKKKPIWFKNVKLRFINQPPINADGAWQTLGTNTPSNFLINLFLLSFV